MTKGKKKTNRRLKKTVRKTLGTLFLISAIIVAAIPTEGLRAADGTEKEVTESYLQQMKIPYLDSKEEIYTTGDGKYQFAYVTDGGSDKGAVILGYNGGYLEGNNLVIPDGLDAYKKYSYSDGTNGGYVAVGKENDFLFYAVNQTTTDPVTGAEIVILGVGTVVAFLVSIVVIRFLMSYIRKHDFKVFGWYRIVLGALVLVYFAFR